MYGTTISGAHDSRSNHGVGGASRDGKSQGQSVPTNASPALARRSRRLDVDGASLDSDGSQRLMIERRVDINVAIEDHRATPVAGEYKSAALVYQGQPQ